MQNEMNENHYMSTKWSEKKYKYNRDNKIDGKYIGKFKKIYSFGFFLFKVQTVLFS